MGYNILPLTVVIVMLLIFRKSLVCFLQDFSNCFGSIYVEMKCFFIEQGHILPITKYIACYTMAPKIKFAAFDKVFQEIFWVVLEILLFEFMHITS